MDLLISTPSRILHAREIQLDRLAYAQRRFVSKRQRRKRQEGGVYMSKVSSLVIDEADAMVALPKGYVILHCIMQQEILRMIYILDINPIGKGLQTICLPSWKCYKVKTKG